MRTNIYLKPKESSSKRNSFIRMAIVGMLCLLYGVGASAQQYMDQNGIVYNITDDGTGGIVLRGGGPSQSQIIEIPATVPINGITLPVVRIEDNALSSPAYSNTTTLILPASITYIGSNAFSACNILFNITFNGTQEPQIMPNAFMRETTRTLNVPNASSGFTATNWGGNVTINYGESGGTTTHTITFFHYISDEGTPVQSTVTVGNYQLLARPADPVRPGYTFDYWASTPDYVNGPFSFETTQILSSFTLYAKWTASVNDGIFTVDGIRYKPLSSAQVEVVGYNADYTLITLTIPATVINGTIRYQVSGISEGAFLQCQTLQKVTIYEGITYVKEAAFAASGITEITFPASLLTIGTGAYRLCTSLASVTYLGTSTPVNMASGAGGSKGNIKRTLYAPNATGGLDPGIWDVDAIIYGAEPPIVEERKETTAIVSWAFVPDAVSYTLYLYSDEAKTQLIATYEFDANGERVTLRASAERAIFNIGSLNGDDSYYFEVEAQNDEQEVLATQVSTIPALRDWPTDIDANVAEVSISIYAYNGYIIIENLSENEVYSIYSVSGMELLRGKSSGSVIKQQVEKGIYIVKTKAKTTKVIVM